MVSRWTLSFDDADRDLMDAIRKPAESYVHLVRRALAGARDADDAAATLRAVRTLLRVGGDDRVKLEAIAALVGES